MIEVIGLNHKSAPIDIREKLAFDSKDTLRALKQLTNAHPDAEFVLLSTCNRVELYWAAQPSTDIDHRALVNFISDYHHVKLTDFEHLMYTYKDEHAASHLLTVTSSLDSMVVGEGQIIRQVKDSYRLACSAKSSGKVLNRLFHCAFSTAKKVHTHTAIGTGRVSIPGVAVELASQLFVEISQANIVVIGAGEMGELLIQHLIHDGCKNITVVNRSLEHGTNIANLYGIKVRPWEDLYESFSQATIIIASASSHDYLFSKEDVIQIMGKRRNHPLLIIDIAVPRNFDPSVNTIENVYVYSIDELSQVAEENRKTREDDIVDAMHIVNQETALFMDWLSAMDIGPLIGEMKNKFSEISTMELEKFFVGNRRQAPCRSVMEPMVKRLVNRLLHCVIKNVNIVVKEHGPTHAAKLLSGIVKQAGEVSVQNPPEEE